MNEFKGMFEEVLTVFYGFMSFATRISSSFNVSVYFTYNSRLLMELGSISMCNTKDYRKFRAILKSGCKNFRASASEDAGPQGEWIVIGGLELLQIVS